MSRLLDPRFKYRNSDDTNVADTFKRFGFKPTTEADRRKAQERLHGARTNKPKATVTPIRHTPITKEK